MRYSIFHAISYSYDCPVQLDTHQLRLRPRDDVSQTLKSYQLQITPQPQHIIQNVDLDGNAVLSLWFSPEPTNQLNIQAIAEVETFRSNPFDYLLERWATNLPLDYPVSLHAQLTPYLQVNSSSGGALLNAFDAPVMELAQDIHRSTEGNTITFLLELNQRIYKECAYCIRETGEPQPPGVTWTKREGSCRDYAVLFMAVCRVMGLASRFVSGYQEGDPDSSDRHLHAWVEVYLPGAGWRGYDPTHGLAVGDRHIALVASPFPQYAAPLSGQLRPGSNAKATMSYQLSIQVNS